MCSTANKLQYQSMVSTIKINITHFCQLTKVELDTKNCAVLLHNNNQIH